MRYPRIQTVIVILALLAGEGCVERKLLIRSDPPGAEVYLDQVRLGETPVEVSFTFYGTREIRLYKDGFLPEAVLKKLSPPVYQYFPVDFISEMLIPFTLVDRHKAEIRLRPEPPELYDRAYMERLLEKAEQFKAEL